MWHLLSFLLMAVIYGLSSRSDAGGIPLVAPWDKVAHAVVYFVLGYLLARATKRPNLAWVIAAWFGALDEVHQAFVPEREAGLDDWWADLFGSLLGSRVGSWHHQRLARKQERSSRPRSTSSYSPPRVP
jgi:VanZ family protein